MVFAEHYWHDPWRAAFEVELKNLDQLEEFRQRGVGSQKGTKDWMHSFSEILLSPPVVEILRVDEAAG